ncbi:protein GVQW3-like [Belonocnema kinseyi]|uniref:protein GVQW3-like n=1 Tax=Belonocnema kinseyi TaxID=2817044 RepID=UPI00143D5457|nr:protein GVQW3-like [Belonocnema kinseyi]
MSERHVPTAVAQRIVVRFLVREGTKNTDIFLRLRNQFGSESLSRAPVFKWAKAFKDRRENVENEPHDRRPRISMTPDNIRCVEQMILDDRRMNVRDISAELGISIGTVESIIHENLQYRKVTSRWVPKLFNFEQKFTRLEVCRRLLTRYEAEGAVFEHESSLQTRHGCTITLPKARCRLKSGGRRRKGRQS